MDIIFIRHMNLKDSVDDHDTAPIYYEEYTVSCSRSVAWHYPKTGGVIGMSLCVWSFVSVCISPLCMSLLSGLFLFSSEHQFLPRARDPYFDLFTFVIFLFLLFVFHFHYASLPLSASDSLYLCLSLSLPYSDSICVYFSLCICPCLSL